MTSHELARLLLENEDLPVLTHANNHTSPLGRIKLAKVVVHNMDGEHRGLLVGNFYKDYAFSSNMVLEDLI